jgi:hypothetical protein
MHLFSARRKTQILRIGALACRKRIQHFRPTQQLLDSCHKEIL